MRADHVVESQRLMAQTIGALAEHIAASTGYQLTGITYDLRPQTAKVGMIQCFTDSTVTTGIVAGGGTNVVLAWFNGTGWKVFAA